MRLKGTLKTWNDERGFGFLQPMQGGEDVFVHISAFGPRDERPQVGEVVLFEVEFGPQGKKRATNVKPFKRTRPQKAPPRRSPAPRGAGSLVAIPVFFVIYVIVSVAWSPSLVIVAVYAGVSLITFYVYAWDKSAAQLKNRRTPEKTLHLLGLVGGWPGALLAQHYLRHKSLKTEFRFTFWVTVVLNIVAFIFLCSPIGQTFLSQYFSATRR